LQQPDVRDQLNPPPRPGRWLGFRLAEYQLRTHNISCPKTAAEEKDCPGWMRMGFTLYRRLEQIGYCPYPTDSASLQWLEVYPHAGYCALLGLTPFPKHTLEGRIQRQLALDEAEVRVPDPMRLFEEITRHRLLQGRLPLDDLYTPSELDALVAAYTAWLVANHPEEVTLLGHPEEGWVVVPVKELKAKYE
jgi:predicted RNase H-like nuclease